MSSPAASPDSKLSSSGAAHREALTKGLADFERMLEEVRSSNDNLNKQLKQFEGQLEEVCFIIYIACVHYNIERNY